MSCCGRVPSTSRDEKRVPEMFFPMWVLPMATFLAMSGPPKSFQELRDLGELVMWRPGMVCVFLSHQWLGYKHADPQGKQLGVLRGALRNIFSGLITVQSEFTMLAYFGKVEELQPADINQLRYAFLWFDWCSIPQITVRRPSETLDMMSDVQKAVDSIPAYVAAADYFLVLCPDAEHHDSGEVCDYSSWKSRGWCRVELLAAMFGSVRSRVINVASETYVHYMYPTRFFSATPAEGEFAVAADRVPLYGVVSRIIDNHLESLYDREEHVVRHRLLTAMRPRFLQGLGTEEQQSQDFDPSHHTVEAFCERFRFRSLLDRPASGFGPVHCAAIEGSIPILEQLVAARADLNEGIRFKKPELLMQPGETPLLLAAAFSGNLAVVRRLLELRADINCRNAVGHGLVCHSSSANRRDVLEFLLERGLDPNASTDIGTTPVLAAAALDEPGTLEVLLRHGANPNASWFTGLTPLQAAVLSGSVQGCRLLLEHRADVNQVTRPTSMMGRVANRSLRLALPFLGSKGKSGPLHLMALTDGGTAVIHAAATGRLAIVQLLLESLADASVKNQMGLDALVVARHYRHESREALLLQSGWTLTF